MNDTIKKYEKLAKQQIDVVKELNELSENDIVKRYLELQNKKTQIDSELAETYGTIKENEYNQCNHIWIVTHVDRDIREGRSERYFGCVKCGLNQKALLKDRNIFGIDFATHAERIMINYFNKYSFVTSKGIISSLNCDFMLASAIYMKLKEEYPEIDDQIAINYLETAVNDIKNISVNDERKVSRAKRLNLTSGFDGWNGRKYT